MRRRLLSLAAAGGLSLATATAGPTLHAFAGVNPGISPVPEVLPTGTGDPSSSPLWGPSIAAKEQIASAYLAYKAGKLSAADYTADAEAYTQQSGEPAPAACTAPINITIAHILIDANGGGCGGGGGTHSIPMNQYPENPNYYCGPSSGMSLLDAMHKNTSALGQGLSQAQLATTANSNGSVYGMYFETDHWGNTPWWSGGNDYPVPSGLNYWIEKSWTGYYIPDQGGTQYGYVQDVQYDIDNGHPLMANTYEQPDTQTTKYPHLKGHPTDQVIGHWIAVMGYEDPKAVGSDYTDPAANAPQISWGAGVPPQSFDYPSTDMAFLIQTKGVVW